MQEQEAAKAEEEAYLDWQKIQAMDHLRLMEDNQKTLDTVTASDRAHRDLQQRVKESMATGNTNAQPATGINYPEDAMSTYRIDSPDEIHNHYAPPPRRSNPLAAALLTAAGLLTGAGAGVGAWQYLNQAKPVQPPAVQTEPAKTPQKQQVLIWDEIEQVQTGPDTWEATGKKLRKRLNADGTIEILPLDGSSKQ